MNEQDLMHNALSAYGLNRQDICRAARRQGAARLAQAGPAVKGRRLPLMLAAVLAAACLGGGVCAAGVLKNARQAAESTAGAQVAALFDADTEINETQTDAGYAVTLLGLTTGEHLTTSWNSSWGEDGPENGTTYAVLAVRKADGTPMPELTDADDSFAPARAFVQPVPAIPGLHPMRYTLHTETYSTTVDGVRYLLVACDNVEIFADRPVVLCVATDSPGFSALAFAYDADTGAITPQADYAGVNLVFDLPLDAAKADPQAAQDFVAQWQAAPAADVDPEQTSSDAALHSLLTQQPQAVRDIGTLQSSETAPYLTQAPQGYQDYDAGPGWYFGDPEDPMYGAWSLGSGDADTTLTELREMWEETWPLGEPALGSMNTDSTTQRRWVWLLTRNEDDSMTAECWLLPYDAQQLYAQLKAWRADPQPAGETAR